MLPALDYVEQPTPRDLGAYTDTLHDVAARVPVVVDESLDDLENLDWIHRLGWSGLAVKTCKGHTHSLLAYCWGRYHRLYLTLQDLTNPGLALGSQRQLLRPPAPRTSTVSRATTASSCPCRDPTNRPPIPTYFQVKDGQLNLPPDMGLGLY